ncbi:ATP-binding protein [Paenibacillus sp. KN14-4R]|uniref:sensor histidine kinase n=1 Tax=Paenibacillus sp. KN14-4R TaxID=3445773 RepID=UPI003F9FE6F4
MKVRWIYLTLLAIFLAGFILSFLVIETKVDTDVDMVTVNEIVKTFERRNGHMEQGDFNAIKQPFIILGDGGTVLFETSPGLFTSIHDAIKHRSVMIDLTLQGAYAGKLLIPNDTNQVIQQMKERLAVVIITTFSILTLLCILYAIFLHKTVFQPFKQLQRFAKHIARGNLDIPLKMNKNNPFGAFTESFDIMREELAAARQSEYAANRSKKELVASLSHDIKTPVATIKAVSELMLIRASEDKEVKQLNMIYSKAEQINLLITDMFHATLEELEELKVTVAEELSDVLNGMIASVNYDDKISYVNIPSCMILTDVTRLQQVFDNILSNAYKYAGTAVQITSHIQDDYLEIHIMDYGKGINKDELPLLFNKFYRGGNVDGQMGSGLGLYISQYLMQKMQGDIACYNRQDGFTVALRIKLA